MSSKLFVGNLSYNVTDTQLHDAFTPHGVVVEASVILDRATGRSRGFGFVTMSTPEEAEAAVEAMNGTSLDNRSLTVNIARPREERGDRGGGGGGGGRGPRGGGYGDRRGGGGGGHRGGGGRDRW